VRARYATQRRLSGILATGGAPRRRFAMWVLTLATAAVLAGASAVQPGSGAGAAGAGAAAAAGTGGGGGAGNGDTDCGGVRFDRASLPGRPLGSAEEAGPTGRVADALGLRGWPRAVPYDAARWTVVTVGDAGVLVATASGQPTRYLPIRRQPTGDWLAGRPCTPRPAR